MEGKSLFQETTHEKLVSTFRQVASVTHCFLRSPRSKERAREGEGERERERENENENENESASKVKVKVASYGKAKYHFSLCMSEDAANEEKNET